MSIAINDDVYIESRIDTGMVVSAYETESYNVLRDSDASQGSHHIDDLHKLPFKRRFIRTGYYMIVDAHCNSGSRKLKVQCYRPTGARIK